MSHSRLSLLPGELSGEQRRLYDQITQGMRSDGLLRLRESDGSLTGPFGPMLLSPSLGSALSELGETLRFGGTLDARVREIVILAVATHYRDSFEWHAHELVARAVGLNPTEIEGVRAEATTQWVDEKEKIAHSVALELLQTRSLSDESFKDAAEVLGLAGMVEVATLIGYYSTLSLLMTVFEIGVPAGELDPFGNQDGGSDAQQRPLGSPQ